MKRQRRIPDTYFGMMQEMAGSKKAGEDLKDLVGHNVYVYLQRMEEEGWVERLEKVGRRVNYRLTPLGKLALKYGAAERKEHGDE